MMKGFGLRTNTRASLNLELALLIMLLCLSVLLGLSWTGVGIANQYAKAAGALGVGGGEWTGPSVPSILPVEDPLGSGIYPIGPITGGTTPYRIVKIDDPSGSNPVDVPGSETGSGPIYTLQPTNPGDNYYQIIDGDGHQLPDPIAITVGSSGPSNGSSTDNGDGSWNVGWVGGTPNYQIVRSTLPDMSNPLPVGTDLPGMNYTIPSLPPGSNYIQIIDHNGQRFTEPILITVVPETNTEILYFRSTVEASATQPAPEEHSTGDSFLGGTWAGCLMAPGIPGASTPASQLQGPSAGAGLYRMTTYTSPVVARATTIPAGNWVLNLYANTNKSEFYARYAVYRWRADDTLGETIVAPGTAATNYTLGASPVLTSLTVPGSSVALSPGDKIVVDVELSTTNSGGIPKAKTTWGTATYPAGVVMPAGVPFVWGTP